MSFFTDKIKGLFTLVNLTMAILPVFLFIIKMKLGTGVAIVVAFLTMCLISFLLLNLKEKKSCDWYPYILPALPITITLIIRFVGLKLLPLPIGRTLINVALIGSVVTFFITPGMYFAAKKLCSG